jgi:POT family proton-dependent oligopeptide transporter
MVLGLVQYRLSKRHLGEAGLRPGQEKPLNGLERAGLICGSAAIVLVVGLGLAGVLQFNPVTLARGTSNFIVAIAVLYFAYVLLFFGLDKTEKQRVGVIIVLFLAAALFWAGFEQAGSSFNLFAKRYTARCLDWFSYEVPGGLVPGARPGLHHHACAGHGRVVG